MLQLLGALVKPGACFEIWEREARQSRSAAPREKTNSQEKRWSRVISFSRLKSGRHRLRRKQGVTESRRLPHQTQVCFGVAFHVNLYPLTL